MMRVSSISWGLFVLLAGGYLFLAVVYPEAYIWATYEDLYGEWLQFFLFLTVFIIAALLALKYKESPYRLFFGVLAVAAFYTVMEEISWGQRLLGFDSPFLFEQYNIQSETNLHNFLTGPESTLLKDVIEYTLASSLILYGVVYPRLLARQWRLAVWLNEKGLFPLPGFLWPFFMTAASLEIGLFHYNEAEVAEILVGSGLVLALMHYWCGIKHGLGIAREWRLSIAVLMVFLCVGTGSVLVTTWILNHPAQRELVERRVLNGLDKFARRFEARGWWRRAAEFSAKVYERDPQREASLRRLVSAYKALGDEAQYQHYYRILLEKNLSPSVRNTTSVDVNLSLGQSFLRAGDTEQSQFYFKRALELAGQALEKNPGNAQAVYRLARVNELMGRKEDAALLYKRASILDTDSVLYSSAYQRLSGLPGE